MCVVLNPVSYCKSTRDRTQTLDFWLVAPVMINVAGVYSMKTYRSEPEEVVEGELNRINSDISSGISKVPSLPLVSSRFEGAHPIV